VDSAFSVMATYRGGRSFAGHFGFDTEYQNRIMVSGAAISMTLDRVFTTPPALENQLFVSRCNERCTVSCPAADAFGLFLTRVFEAIETKTWEGFARVMHEDATFRERMRLSSEERER
jgi:NDP-hexose-3-ketoreductase